MTIAITVAAFVFFWAMVGLIWGGLMAYALHKGIAQAGLAADAVCGIIGFAIMSTVFLWHVEFTQHIVGIFVVIPAAKLSQDYLLVRLGRRRSLFRR